MPIVSSRPDLLFHPQSGMQWRPLNWRRRRHELSKGSAIFSHCKASGGYGIVSPCWPRTEIKWAQSIRDSGDVSTRPSLRANPNPNPDPTHTQGITQGRVCVSIRVQYKSTWPWWVDCNRQSTDNVEFIIKLLSMLQSESMTLWPWTVVGTLGRIQDFVKGGSNLWAPNVWQAGGVPPENFKMWNVGDAISRVFRVNLRQKRGSTEPIEPPPPPLDPPQELTAKRNVHVSYLI